MHCFALSVAIGLLFLRGRKVNTICAPTVSIIGAYNRNIGKRLARKFVHKRRNIKACKSFPCSPTTTGSNNYKICYDKSYKLYITITKSNQITYTQFTHKRNDAVLFILRPLHKFSPITFAVQLQLSVQSLGLQSIMSDYGLG